MCALLAGIFNSRPPQPKYCFTRNVQTVIEFIRKEWKRNQELSDKFLTYKLTMLLAVTSASRALGLQHLNIRFMVKTPSSFTFTFQKLHKVWKSGKSPSSVVFHSFKEDSSLCVAEVLKEYLKRSEKWITSDEFQNGKNFTIGKLSYLQRYFKSQFLINGFEQGMGSGLEYYLRTETVAYSIRSYGDFMK